MKMICDEDRFYRNRDADAVDWLYYNEDAQSGGQYVWTKLRRQDYCEALEAKQDGRTGESDLFDILIGSARKTTLYDIGTEEFEYAKERFHGTADWTGRTAETFDQIGKALGVL